MDSSIVPPPFLISYAITRRCNLKCKHCYSDSSESAGTDELSTQEAKALLDDIASWNIHLLIFDGGEPLYRADFFDIARHASKRGLRVVVGSNGTLIDSNVARELKLAGVMGVQISIDGATASSHDEFRGQKGSYESALAGARACKEVDLPFQFGMTIRRSTLDQVPDMLDLSIRSGATAAEFFDLVQVPRVKKEVPHEVLSPLERKGIMTWLADAQENCPIIIRVPGCPMYTLLLQSRNIRPKRFSHRLLERIPYYGRGCAAGMPNGYLTILPNGDIIPCMLFQSKLGNVREAPIHELWNTSPLLLKLRDRSLLEGDCGRCEHKTACAGCRGRAYEETGNAMSADPGCWIPQEIVNSREDPDRMIVKTTP